MFLMRKLHLVGIVGIAIFVKCVYVGFAAIEYRFNQSELSEEFEICKNSFYNNDSGWYLTIAEDWYPKIKDKRELGCCSSDCVYQSFYAFFPAYPGLIRILSKIFSIPFITIGIGLAHILSIACFLIMYMFFTSYLQNADKGFFISVIMIVFPFHYFFSTMYTESLFLICLLLSFYGINNNKLWITSVFFTILVITRPNGLIMGLPLLIFLLEKQYRNYQCQKLSKKFVWRFVLKQWIWLPSLIVFFSFCYFLFLQTGDFLAFKTAQIGWCKQNMMPYEALFIDNQLHTKVNSVYVSLMLLVMGMSLIFNSWKISFYVLVLLNIIMPLSYGSTVSMPRYISVLFPLFITIGSFVNQFKAKWIFVVVLFFAQLATFHFWIIAPHLLGL
jgi:Gpi18-like mannosyltransferase